MAGFTLAGSWLNAGGKLALTRRPGIGPLEMLLIAGAGFMTKERCEPVYELQKKIEFLKGHLFNGSENSLAKAAGVSRSAFRAARESGGKTEDKMSTEVQGKLARVCGFELGWVEWIDPQAQKPSHKRQDTAESFKERYLRENPSRTCIPPTEPRHTHVRLRAVHANAPPPYDEQLASMVLQASQAGSGEPWPISIELTCWEALVDWVFIAVKRGRLYINCGQARTEYQAGEVDCSRDACKVIVRRPASRRQLSCEIIADPGPIGLLSLPHDFFLVHGLAAGDTIAASFRVCIKDLDEPTQPHDDEESPPQEESSFFMFVRRDFRKLGRAKQTILKRLAALALPEGPPGWVQLCSDVLRFEEDGKAHDQDEQKI